MRLTCETMATSHSDGGSVICRATFESDLNNNKSMYYPEIPPVGISHK